MSVELKEERIILIELAGPGTAALVCCSSDRLEAPDWRPRAPLLDPGMALARDSICGEAATRESAHSRNFRALNQEGSATHMESMPAAMTEVSGLSAMKPTVASSSLARTPYPTLQSILFAVH